jgi:glycogen(starch) synthase
VDLPKLLCLGRLVPNKGFDLALTAFASIRDRYPHARVIIAGEGTERPSLERQATRLGLSQVVDFLGSISPGDVWALLNRATIVVVPSRGWEALPLVALEGAFMARPVVASRDGGLPEVVVHKKTGWLVEKDDSTGLAQAFSFFLEHPEAVIQMGQAARQRAHDVFSIARCVDAYDILYRKLAAQAPYANRWCS